MTYTADNSRQPADVPFKPAGIGFTIRAHCMRCNQHRPQAGGKGRPGPLWRCSVCVAAAKRRDDAAAGSPPSAASITAERLRECLSYDPQTGVFVWLSGCASSRHVGKVAGSFDGKGYRLIKIEQVVAKAHRLAWLYMTGEHPRGEIDHINGDRADNRWANLRDVSVEINRQNRRHGTGVTGLLGVSPADAPGTFRASIKVNRKQYRLGVFSTAEAAHEAYLEAKDRLHPGSTMCVEAKRARAAA